MFSKLLKTADKFLAKLNLRRLKMGTIIEFLDRFGMVQSKEAMAKVILTIKVSGKQDFHLKCIMQINLLSFLSDGVIFHAKVQYLYVVYRKLLTTSLV